MKPGLIWKSHEKISKNIILILKKMIRILISFNEISITKVLENIGTYVSLITYLLKGIN